MRRKVSLSIAIVLFACAFAFASELVFRPSVRSDVGGAFCYPTADYLKQYPGDSSISNPPIRTSWSYGFDINPMGLLIENPDHSGFGFGFGLSYVNVSQSLAYGISILKPYWGIGFNTDVRYQFDSALSLGVVYRYLNCRYTGSKNHFLSQDVGIVPSYAVLDDKCRISVSLPLTVSIKADAVTFRIGAALEIAFDVRREEGR